MTKKRTAEKPALCGGSPPLRRLARRREHRGIRVKESFCVSPDVYEIGCYWHKSNMISPHLLEIERSIRSLSLEEQEWLLERIKRQVQEKKLTAYKFIDKKYMNEQLAAMANDLDIQTEIPDINEEFTVTEMDGLEKL